MVTGSSQTGFLVPAPSPAPENATDSDLDALLALVVRNLTGLPAGMVRPRWQLEPAQLPEHSVSWCAVGVPQITRDVHPAIVHTDDGTTAADVMLRSQELEVLVSFYGPQCVGLAHTLGDALQCGQNGDELLARGFGFIECTGVVQVPALLKAQWQRRADITVRLRRLTSRTFPVSSIVSAGATVHADGHTINLTT